MEDTTQSSSIYNFLAWLEVNKKRVLTGAIIVAVVAIAIAAYLWNKEESEKRANQALFAVAPGAAAAKTPPDPAKYSQVAKEHPNTSAAERAQLLAATAAFTKGDYAGAQQQFEAFVNDHGSSELRSQAAFGIAASLEAQGKLDAAVAKYEEIARQNAKESVGSQAKLALARLNETKSPEKAVQLYSEMEQAPGPFDAWKSEAADRREKLLSRHPELRKQSTNAEPFEQIIEVTTPPAAEGTNSKSK